MSHTSCACLTCIVMFGSLVDLNHPFLFPSSMTSARWSHCWPEAHTACMVLQHNAIGLWATASSQVWLSGSLGGPNADGMNPPVSSTREMLVKASMTWFEQMLVTCGKHHIWLSLWLNSTSWGCRSISSSLRKALLSEVLLRVQWSPCAHKHQVEKGKKMKLRHALTVTPTWSNRWRAILASLAPLWLPWRWWNVISVEHSWTVLLSPPQIPAGLHYNFGDFELEEKNSVKFWGILRTT